MVQILLTKINHLILKVGSITIKSLDSLTGMVKNLRTKINCLILKVKSITSESPDSLTRKYYAHKKVFGADNVVSGR